MCIPMAVCNDYKGLFKESQQHTQKVRRTTEDSGALYNTRSNMNVIRMYQLLMSYLCVRVIGDNRKHGIRMNISSGGLNTHNVIKLMKGVGKANS